MLMARGRRRDKWDRLASLMSLIWDRTNFEDKPKPSRPIDFMPKCLLDADDIVPTTEPKPEPITVHDLIALSGAK